MRNCGKHLTAGVAALAIVSLSACGSDEQSQPAAPTGTASPEAWCEAIEQLAAAQPDGSFGPEEFEAYRAAFLAYADAADAAAAVAVDDADVLAKLAAAARVSAADAGDPAQVELYGEIAGGMAAIAGRAERDCGVTFG